LLEHLLHPFVEQQEVFFGSNPQAMEYLLDVGFGDVFFFLNQQYL